MKTLSKEILADILCQLEAEMAFTRTCSLIWSAARIVLVERRGYTSNNHAVTALRSKKAKSKRNMVQHFVDVRAVRAVGGTGGDGEISFLQLWSNEEAGPDGGDGGNGGHVVLEASLDIRDLNHMSSILKADPGERGYNKDCSGKNADHTVVKCSNNSHKPCVRQVPVGTIVKTATGRVIADLSRDGSMFVAARGGAGGHGNHFFVSDTAQSPQVAEFGAQGEDLQYVLEVRSMAHIGLIGLPNAGKSTLLQAISRARPKIAPYPFTTLKPHLGMVQYDDYEQIAVADLPGLISGSHQNKGLGIAFLKHTERCAALMFVVDLSCSEPWHHVDLLRYELGQFSSELIRRPQVVVGNKLDLPESKPLEDLCLDPLPHTPQLVRREVVGNHIASGYSHARSHILVNWKFLTGESLQVRRSRDAITHLDEFFARVLCGYPSGVGLRVLEMCVQNRFICENRLHLWGPVLALGGKCLLGSDRDRGVEGGRDHPEFVTGELCGQLECSLETGDVGARRLGRLWLATPSPLHERGD
uniref:Mitochondrial ribosome-associated GTPase 2 n=1 Tax=Timema monikensis TaxID=170555 RepID=A0A7R9EAH5_9NEOP|nr:unnamed protein product [Timema monikensis]